jgi:hypothetical protein
VEREQRGFLSDFQLIILCPNWTRVLSGCLRSHPTCETRRGLRWVPARVALVHGNRRAARRAWGVMERPSMGEGPAALTPGGAAAPLRPQASSGLQLAGSGVGRLPG